MITKETLLKDYERYLFLKGHRSRESYLKSVEEFLDFLDENKSSYNQANFALVIEYRSRLLSENTLSRSTVNNKMIRLRNFYKYLFRKGLVMRNPFRRIKNLRKGKSIPKSILNVDDMGKLLNNLSVMSYSDLMLKVVIEFLYGSSMRIAEVEALKTSDLDFESGAVWITNFKDNSRRWKAPATEVSLREAKAYIKNLRGKLLSEKELEEGWLFPQWEGKTALRCLLNRKLQRECKRLGLKVITSHGFRHSSATHMLKAGAGIREVQMMLGHRRITSTQVYLRIVKEDLKTVIANYHPREKQEAL